MSDDRSGPPPEPPEGSAPDPQQAPVVRPASGAVARTAVAAAALRGERPPGAVEPPLPVEPPPPPAAPPPRPPRPPEPEEPEAEQLPAMSLFEHLEELRQRLMWCVATLGVTFCVAWYYCEPIFHFLARPIYRFLGPGQKLVMLSVADAFLLYMKVAAIAAVFASSPVLLFHLWRFIQPGLYKRERRYALGFVICGTVLFLSGGAFAYYVAFPFAVQFLLGVGQEFTPAITGENYLGFLLTVIVGLGLMFELPVVIVFLARVGIVTPRFLMRYFRHATVIIFIVAAIITPTPDVFNLCLFAVPTLFLYLLGVGAAAILGRKRPEAVESDLAAESDAARA